MKLSPFQLRGHGEVLDFLWGDGTPPPTGSRARICLQSREANKDLPLSLQEAPVGIMELHSRLLEADNGRAGQRLRALCSLPSVWLSSDLT